MASRLLIIILLHAACVLGYAQNFMCSFGGLANDEALSIGTDSLGNIFTTGYFNNSFSFNGNSISSNGVSDVFVAQNGSTGANNWIFGGGSTGPDRGIDISVFPDGSSVITGYHSHNAQFDGIILPSNNFSQDILILKLDPNGQLEWVRSFGGEYSDVGNGVDCDQFGNIFITGSFRGTIDFDGVIFTSTPSAQNDNLSTDVFVLKLNPEGEVIWAKHGQSSYDSRGLDIKTDSYGNVVVAGQFSDTLTFDLPHANEVFNAGFVVKFDEAGSELWFRRFTSVQTIPNALIINNNDEVIVTGDNIGPMFFYNESENFYFPVSHTYNVFVAKYDQNGGLEWVSNNGSSNLVSSNGVTVDVLGNIYITGTYNCRFDEYSEEYGSGIFYSAGWRDVFISIFDLAGNRIWSRNLASRRDCYSGGITIQDEDLPIISGSFENQIVAASDNNFSTDNNSLPYTIAGTVSTFCGDSNYDSARRLISQGNKDVFIASPIVLTREPLDFFQRETIEDCSRPYKPVCVNFCADTLYSCGSTSANYSTYISGVLSPQFNIEWSSPDANPWYNLDVPESGIYYLNYERLDGCLSFADTLVAVIYPLPSPTITDNLGINTFHPPPQSIPIELCYPDSVHLMGSNFSELDSIWWTSPSGGYTPTANDSAIYAHSVTGFRRFHIKNEHGCTLSNRVHVSVFHPVDTVEAYIGFPGLEEPVDTVFVCENPPGHSFLAALMPIQSSGTDIQFVANNSDIEWSIDPETANISHPTINHSSANIYPSTSGFYTISVEISGKCDSTYLYIERTIYVQINPSPTQNLTITGQTEICPGDYAQFVSTGGYNYSWSGPEFEQISPDTIIAWMSGTYFVSSTAINEYGCTNSQTYLFSLDYQPAPVVSMLPENGIICPDDSVMLSTTPGIEHIWYGPSGQIDVSSETIYVNEPGTYFCLVTDGDSCTMESNFVEVNTYTSPYLMLPVGNDLCIDGSVEIEAVADNSANVFWDEPLNTTGSTVVVTEPGEYSASITQCGITTTQSVTIFETEVNAEISYTTLTVCNGDSILLSGNPGMAMYEWVPSGEMTPEIWVSELGEYQLNTYNYLTCMASSESVVVTDQLIIELALPENIYVCPNDSLLLSTDAEYAEYLWEPLGQSTPEIWITEPGVYSVYAIAGNGCSGVSASLEILQGETPDLPDMADILHCQGDDLIIELQGEGSAFWLSEGEPVEANPLVLEALEADTLLHFFIMAETGCTSEIGSVWVEVLPNMYTPIILGDTVVCPGDTVLLSTSELPYSTYAWLIDGEPWSEDFEMIVPTNLSTPSPISVTLNVHVGVCARGTQSHQIVVLPLPDSLPILGNPFPCDGSPALLHTQAPDSVEILWSWNQYTHSSDTVEVFQEGPDSILVVLTAILNGCAQQPTQLWVNHQPYPTIDELSSNSPICMGDILSISAVTDDFAGLTITTPEGFTIWNNTLNIFPSDTLDTGWYYLQAGSPYCETMDSIWVDVFPVPDISLGNDSTYCEGYPALFQIDGFELIFWQDSIFGPSYQTSTEGMVKVEVMNDYGCTTKDSVMVWFESCDGALANVFTPNGDGINDFFNFNPYGFENLHVIIYNRWGSVVCELHNIDYWDGIHCKSNRPVSDGTYFYVASYSTRHDKTGVKKGYIQVFR